MVFKPGQSGNPLGAKLYNQKPIAFQARRYASAALGTLANIMKDKKAPHSARVSASQVLLDRAYGKAPTFSTTDTKAFKRAIDMTDDELIEIVERAKLTLVPKLP